MLNHLFECFRGSGFPFNTVLVFISNNSEVLHDLWVSLVDGQHIALFIRVVSGKVEDVSAFTLPQHLFCSCPLESTFKTYVVLRNILLQIGINLPNQNLLMVVD